MNAKGIKSLIFKLLNNEEENKKFEICFQFVAQGFVEIEWDDYDNLIKDNDYSGLEEIIRKYFIPDVIGNYDGFGSISYHPDFKLTLSYTDKREYATELEEVLDSRLNKLSQFEVDSSEFTEVEYEITNEGINEIKYGSTNKFWDSLKKF